MSRAFYIFDLDGTLADQTHRQHLIGKDWPAYFRACPADKPIDAVCDLLRALWRSGASVEIWSGRSDLVFEETCEWLDDNGIPVKALTRMRPEKDHRPDDDLKRKWLHEARARGREPTLVFEDRSRVVAMWRAEGVPCCQVAPGDF